MLIQFGKRWVHYQIIYVGNTCREIQCFAHWKYIVRSIWKYNNEHVGNRTVFYEISSYTLNKSCEFIKWLAIVLRLLITMDINCDIHSLPHNECFSSHSVISLRFVMFNGFIVSTFLRSLTYFPKFLIHTRKCECLCEEEKSTQKNRSVSSVGRDHYVDQSIIILL